MPSVKPKIKKENGLWVCRSLQGTGAYYGLGKTPEDAYQRWAITKAVMSKPKA